MPRYEMHTNQISPLSVHHFDVDSSDEAFQQFAAEVKRIQAAGQARYGVGRFLVELFDDKGGKIGSVSVHYHGMRELEPP